MNHNFNFSFVYCNLISINLNFINFLLVLTVLICSPLCSFCSKAKTFNTCIAPQAAYCSCSGAVHVTHKAGCYRP